MLDIFNLDLFYLLKAGEAVRYLEFCVHKLGCQDQAIHNYLLALYARLNPDKLMQYLASQGNVKIIKQPIKLGLLRHECISRSRHLYGEL